jgi:alcohol/geraniol dehydrogenase (NADP+)
MRPTSEAWPMSARVARRASRWVGRDSCRCNARPSSSHLQTLKPYEYDPGLLGAEEVEIAVESCGIWHCDLHHQQRVGHLSLPRRAWSRGDRPCGGDGATSQRGDNRPAGRRRLGRGQLHALSPMPFGRSKPLRPECSYHSAAQGGFADRLRVQWSWAIPLPEGLNTADAGPLLCGGTTVFTPLLVFGVKPTDRGSRGPDPRTRAGLDRLPMVLARR